MLIKGFLGRMYRSVHCEYSIWIYARALIELEMLLNTSAGGRPRTAWGERQGRRVLRGGHGRRRALNEGPVNIILSYLHKEDHEN